MNYYMNFENFFPLNKLLIIFYNFLIIWICSSIDGKNLSNKHISLKRIIKHLIQNLSFLN